MKKLVSLLLASVMALCLVACGGEGSGSTGKTYNWIYAADCAEDTVQGLMIKYFAEQLNEKSGGRMTVQLHFKDMGSDVECCEATQSGDITFYNSAVSTTSNFFPEATAIDLPYLYPNVEVYRKAMDDAKVFEFYTKKYQENGFHLLGLFDEGMRELTSNKLVQKAADLNGLKIRVMDNAFHVSIWNALGANATPMAMAEVYIGLQQGTIDAQENGIETVYANKVYEQQKYMIFTNHLPSSRILLMNEAIYQSLSDADKKIVDEVGKAAVLYAREQCDARANDRKELMAQAGIEYIDLEASVLEELMGKCDSIYNDVRKSCGDEVVDMLINAVNAAK